MRKILLTILMLLPGIPAFAAIAHVQTPVGGTDCGSVTNCSLTFVSNNTAGNFILVMCRYAATGRTVTITDTGLNSYVGDASSINASNVTDGSSNNLQWAHNIAGGANTVKCTVSGAASTMRIIVSEFSGVATSNALDTSITASGNGTTPASGNVSPAQDGELLYAWEGNGASPAASILAGTDFTIATTVPNSSSNRVASEYYIQPTATSHNGTFTVSQTNWAAGLAAFKAASTTVTHTNTIQGVSTLSGVSTLN